MTKQELTELVISTFGYGGYEEFTNAALDIVRAEIKRHQTNWSVVDVDFCAAGKLRTEFIPRGYRKNTTGEYVPNSYLNNFGWKNTYYQHASLYITIPEQGIFDRVNETLKTQ